MQVIGILLDAVRDYDIGAVRKTIDLLNWLDVWPQVSYFTFLGQGLPISNDECNDALTITASEEAKLINL